ncbi:MAG: hypothetical protein HKP56_05280 [Anderseniella sp.]|nr:hypothetical protein [Anderseniella sp.]
MTIQIDMKLIDKGRTVAEPSITDDNIDGAVFDFREALRMLKPGQWLYIVTQLPADQARRFAPKDDMKDKPLTW